MNYTIKITVSECLRQSEAVSTRVSQWLKQKYNEGHEEMKEVCVQILMNLHTNTLLQSLGLH